MIEDMLELKEKIFIIKHADLDDAKIMDGNYLQLIHDTADSEAQQQFSILRTNTQRRIQELTD
jgi:hypothetical protein